MKKIIERLNHSYFFVLVYFNTDTDRDFDPSAEMMIHDYDDERTLEEEENQSGGSCSGELDDLEKVRFLESLLWKGTALQSCSLIRH